MRGRRLRRRRRPRPSPQGAGRLPRPGPGRRAHPPPPPLSGDVQPGRAPPGAAGLARAQPRRARARARASRSPRAFSPCGASAAAGRPWRRCGTPWSRCGASSPASRSRSASRRAGSGTWAPRRLRSTSSPRGRAWWSWPARWPTAPSSWSACTGTRWPPPAATYRRVPGGRAGRSTASAPCSSSPSRSSGNGPPARRWPQGWFAPGHPWLTYPSASNLHWLRQAGLAMPDGPTPESSPRTSPSDRGRLRPVRLGRALRRPPPPGARGGRGGARLPLSGAHARGRLRHARAGDRRLPPRDPPAPRERAVAPDAR